MARAGLNPHQRLCPRLTLGKEQQIVRPIRAADLPTQAIRHCPAVMLRQPGIRGGDQQVDVGIGPGLASCPRTEQMHLCDGDLGPDRRGHRAELGLFDRGDSATWAGRAGWGHGGTAALRPAGPWVPPHRATDQRQPAGAAAGPAARFPLCHGPTHHATALAGSVFALGEGDAVTAPCLPSGHPSADDGD